MKQTFNHVQFLLVFLSVFLLVPLTGCWSSHEIEERSLGVGVALDKGKESMIEKEFDEQGGGYARKNLITSTYQLITPQVASSTTKQGGPQQKSYVNVSETGDSAFQMLRELSLRSDTPLTSPHMKVMVIGEALARSYSLEQLVDQSLRDNDFRPSCLMFISKGRASDTLESKTAGEIPAFRLSTMVENAYRTTRILPPMPLIKLESKIQSRSSFLLQNVVSANGEIKFAGAGIIKGKTNKMIGFLNEEELDGLTWITGKGKGGLVKSFDKKTGQLIVYEIESMKSRIQPHVKGNNISFDVHIESVGRLSESWMTSGSSFNNQFLQNAQKTSEKKVKHLVRNVLEKMQTKYKVDVAGFGNQLRIKRPGVWMRVKDNWDQTFSEVPINYDVKLTIKDYGASGSKK
ncbi:Ger(x)C family spore germination protein [Priestia sp. Y58]|uniref:Ger(x)C family spore germination protein n=1 Tax=Priestia TaxID=2800373 RepID=UPI001C8E8E2B|nr:MULTISPECIES: Ger(x)C family spore germination protein [Priestia]MBX9986882.1 Ger(x)C family spore germination protein [Priestia aryabhattai]MBX9999233.1 Ger(x)C family spore germination protein [Priestia aryabhattai]MCZ8495193.1 Ger(x)C family spore germination protein [Priestia megaterium]MDG0030252.1 Ger(x)C family spore germination protein [Priestia sp. Y58]MDG0059707.1 Ger(x)C family spore germination protein [Priestia sp. P5]